MRENNCRVLYQLVVLKSLERAFMEITYTKERNFTPQQVAKLFLSVRWVVGKYPDRLHKALMNSSRVISAWDGDRLVGLIRVMDDSELVCFINYVLVHPDYQGQGIAGHLLEIVKDAYRSYLYINVMIGEPFTRNMVLRSKTIHCRCSIVMCPNIRNHKINYC